MVRNKLGEIVSQPLQAYPQANHHLTGMRRISSRAFFEHLLDLRLAGSVIVIAVAHVMVFQRYL
jgi:hypothetical protein